MIKSPAFIIPALLGALCMPASAQQAPAASTMALAASAPGKATLARTVKVTATVEAIDVAKRQVTLKGPRGNSVPLTVDPEVRNLDQVKVGDQVVVRYIEALSLTLKKDGKELRGRTESSDAARAAAGAQPGAAAARQVEVTADVIAVNAKTQMVTLKGPNQTVDLKVRDPAQLKLIKVGDQIQAVYTEAVAVGVEPAKK
jgi:Cu/Ag efflux protein CusF